MVYFVRLISTGHVKIGYSANVPARMQSLLRDHGPLDLLAVIPGTMIDERAHHDRFNALRVVGEWFTPDAALLGYIDSLPKADGIGPVAWASPEVMPFHVEPPDLTPLPSWLAATGGAAARGLPLRPPARRCHAAARGPRRCPQAEPRASPHPARAPSSAESTPRRPGPGAPLCHPTPPKPPGSGLSRRQAPLMTHSQFYDAV